MSRAARSCAYAGCLMVEVKRDGDDIALAAPVREKD